MIAQHHRRWDSSRRSETARARMALAALEFRHVHPDVHRMAKRLGLQARLGDLLGRTLSEDRMARRAVLRQDLPFATLVQPIVAAKASFGIQMANVIWVHAPIGAHLGKEVPLVDALQFSRRLLNRDGLVPIDLRIFLLVKRREPLEDGGGIAVLLFPGELLSQLEPACPVALHLLDSALGGGLGLGTLRMFQVGLEGLEPARQVAGVEVLLG